MGANEQAWKAPLRLAGRHAALEPLSPAHADGSVRDTVAFSIIESEWPAVKRNLLDRLARGGRDHG